MQTTNTEFLFIVLSKFVKENKSVAVRGVCKLWNAIICDERFLLFIMEERKPLLKLLALHCYKNDPSTCKKVYRLLLKKDMSKWRLDFLFERVYQTTLFSTFIQVIPILPCLVLLLNWIRSPSKKSIDNVPISCENTFILLKLAELDGYSMSIIMTEMMYKVSRGTELVECILNKWKESCGESPMKYFQYLAEQCVISMNQGILDIIQSNIEKYSISSSYIFPVDMEDGEEERDSVTISVEPISFEQRLEFFHKYRFLISPDLDALCHLSPERLRMIRYKSLDSWDLLQIAMRHKKSKAVASIIQSEGDNEEKKLLAKYLFTIFMINNNGSIDRELMCVFLKCLPLLESDLPSMFQEAFLFLGESQGLLAICELFKKLKYQIKDKATAKAVYDEIQRTKELEGLLPKLVQLGLFCTETTRNKRRKTGD